MKVVVRRLISATLALVVALVMMFSMMHAWYTLSSAPEVGGIEIAISGGTNILFAANKTYNADGVVYNYPAVKCALMVHQAYDDYIDACI